MLGTEREDVDFSERSRGPFWRSVVLPLREGNYSEATFLLGFLREFGGDFAPPPEPGACVGLDAVETSAARARTGERTSQRSFRALGVTRDSSLTPPEDLLFTVFEEESGSLVALGRFNSDGTARCDLPRTRLAISTGFGTARLEVAAEADATDIDVVVSRRGRLRVDPGAEGSIDSLEGHILRIGRKASVPALNARPEALRLPLSVEGDLFRVIPNPSENAGAKEILEATILVGASPFSLALEPGDYIAALVRPGEGTRCLVPVAIRADAQTTLACPKSPTPAPNEDSSRSRVAEALLDATFLPERFVASLQMRRWLAVAGLTHVLRAGKPGALSPEGRPPERLDVSFAPLPRAHNGLAPARAAGPFAGWFGGFSAFEEILRSQQARVLVAPEMLEAERLVGAFLQNTDQTVLPLGGTGEAGIEGRATPFLVTTRLRYPAGEGFSPEAAEVLVTNGVDIEWIDPAVSDGVFPLRMPLQQRFRARVRIPPGHRPEYAEIYVNSRLHKRWYVPRLDPTAWETFDVDERLDEAQDFYVAVAVWGQPFLPELVYGSSTMPPMAFTRSYCVDANENGLCEALR